jgi:Beta-1,3-glucanase
LVHTGGIMGGGLVLPTSQNPSDPNFNTMFDFTELTWIQQAPIPGHPEITTNLGINVTEVDSFGLAQQYIIEGTDPATFQPNTALTSGFLSTARRPTLLDALQNFGPPWR